MPPLVGCDLWRRSRLSGSSRFCGPSRGGARTPPAPPRPAACARLAAPHRPCLLPASPVPPAGFRELPGSGPVAGDGERLRVAANRASVHGRRALTPHKEVGAGPRASPASVPAPCARPARLTLQDPTRAAPTRASAPFALPDGRRSFSLQRDDDSSRRGRRVTRRVSASRVTGRRLRRRPGDSAPATLAGGRAGVNRTGAAAEGAGRAEAAAQGGRRGRRRDVRATPRANGAEDAAREGPAGPGGAHLPPAVTPRAPGGGRGSRAQTPPGSALPVERPEAEAAPACTSGRAAAAARTGPSAMTVS